MQARRIQTTIQTDGDITSQELTDLLLNNENFLNFSIVDFEISRLDGCPKDDTEVVYPGQGMIIAMWNESSIGNHSIACPCGNITTIYLIDRQCQGDFINQAVWEEPDDTMCLELNFDLCQIAAMPPLQAVEALNDTFAVVDSVAEIAQVSMIIELFANSTEIAENEDAINNYLDVFEEFLNLEAELTRESQEIAMSSETVIESIEEFADAVLVAMNGTENVTLARENFAVLAVEPQPDSTGQIESFVVQVEVGEPLSNASDFNNAVFSSSPLPSGDPLAYVVMNENLIQALQNTSNEPDQDPRFIFIVYEINSTVFQDPDGNGTGSVVLTVLRSPDQGPPPTNLDEPVMFQFQVDPGRMFNSSNGDTASCVFWNFSLNNGIGGWSTEGCFVGDNSTDGVITCFCDHLTSFTILLDVNPPERLPETDLTRAQGVISYIGGVISSIFLLLTALTYLFSKKLRSGVHGQLLIHMCLALLGLFMSFIISSLLGRYYGDLNFDVREPFCIGFSALVHYFFLVYFLITAAQSILLYLKLVKVLGTSDLLNQYTLKVGIISWILPIVIVVLFLGPAHDQYLNKIVNENGTEISAICFPRQWPSRLGIITPFGVIYIFNIIMFIRILVSVLRHGNNKGEKEDKYKKNLKRAFITFVLAIMFGVGWVFGVLGSSGLPPAISIACQFTFIFVITFQGLFLFLLHPCRSKDAREEWRRWFYYATCRTEAYESQLKQSKLSKAHSGGDHSTAPRPKTSSTAVPSSSPRGPSPRNPTSRGPSQMGTASRSPSSRGASKYGYNRKSPDTSSIANRFGYTGGRRASESSAAASAIANKFGYSGGRRASDYSAAAAAAGGRQASHTGKMGDLLTIPGPGAGSSIPPSYSPELEQVLENDSFVEDGTSSHCSSPSSPEERKTNLRQMFIFDNRTDELISLEDSNADATSQFGNISFGADSDLLMFSPESDSIMLANEGAQHREELTWQTFEYDDEQQTGAATIFYNFEDDSS